MRVIYRNGESKHYRDTVRDWNVFFPISQKIYAKLEKEGMKSCGVHDKAFGRHQFLLYPWTGTLITNDCFKELKISKLFGCLQTLQLSNQNAGSVSHLLKPERFMSMSEKQEQSKNRQWLIRLRFTWMCTREHAKLHSRTLRGDKLSCHEVQAKARQV